jgi:hypothetical protein
VVYLKGDKMLKGKRTLIFAIATAIVPLLSMTGIVDLVPEEYTNLYLFGVALATAVLRVITTTPIGKGKE